MDTDADVIEQHLIAGITRKKPLTYSERLLIRSLACVTEKILGNPDSSLASLLAQQRQLINLYHCMNLY